MVYTKDENKPAKKKPAEKLEKGVKDGEIDILMDESPDVIYDPIFTSVVPSDEELRKLRNDMEKKGKRASKRNDASGEINQGHNRLASDKDTVKRRKKKPEKPRHPEWENHIFSDEEGNCNGWRALSGPDFDNPDGNGYISTYLYFNDGKLNGDPAVIDFDGLEEIWEDGKFVSVKKKPYADLD